MGLNGIDISGWQEGIDLSAVAADFCNYESYSGYWICQQRFC